MRIDMSSKKLRPLVVTNDDNSVKRIVDKSKAKLEVITNERTNGELNELSGDSTDEEVDNPFVDCSVERNYFNDHSKRCKTSTKTLSKLMQNFELTQTKINDIIDEQMKSERNQLKQQIKCEYFDKWLELMVNGFNVLLYGVGSKRQLIEMFVKQSLQSCHRLVIHGYANDITVKSVLNVFNCALNESLSDENGLLSALKQIEFDIYLVIHSIDMLFAGKPKVKSFVNKLVSIDSRLHIIASVDHINSAMIWSSSECQAYKWISFNATTFDSYIVEKSFAKSLSSTKTSAANSWTQKLTLSSVQHVYDSLTSNSQQIFVLILKHFIENDKGFPFYDCYQLCREEFLVNSEITLRAQLSEFKDHKMLKIKKGVDGGEMIHISIDKLVAQQFLDNK